ncbi:MAG: MBL fold metallo-hydrolase [Chitinophagales bacterium]|nr:MBL fold metallo-hydrolase [Bacteroidota bacterium]MCB9042664.1 MBL fold metallo-hydrolase [Chitinophagales bacterium]
MLQIKQFTFNDFYENTYIVHNESNECIIIDAGCYTTNEKKQLKAYIEQQNLQPVRLLNTHCHIDHVFGNKFIAETWNLLPEFHANELPLLQAVPVYAENYGFKVAPMDWKEPFLSESGTLHFGNSKIELLFTPGHSPGSLSFYFPQEKVVFSGDSLFQQSIGRTDLPGGNYQTLIRSIQSQLFSLPDEVQVLSGHGRATTIGEERKYNPFVGEVAMP